MVRLIARYQQPDDQEAFDAHCRDVLAPIVERYPKLRSLRLTKLVGAGGRPAPYHLMAEMSFDSDQDLAEAVGSAPSAESARDLRNFAQAGVTVPRGP
ncbi:MAG: EthD family reductase [Chloroflexota bacterium]|nr:EthD family reductase [Chloroflexota bacterium]